ncbi:MAG: DUF3800 domain-containing protein [Candidatus Dormibacteraceae bacterium]
MNSLPSRSLQIWGDESGNLDFDPRTGTRYFFVATITVEDLNLTHDLLELRRQLDEEGYDLTNGFHATEDRQAVRDQVFELLRKRSIRVDITYYEKKKVYDRIKEDLDYFYKWAWFSHLKYALPKIVPLDTKPFIGIATLGRGKKRDLHSEALRNVVKQCLCPVSPHCAHWSAASHPCLQAADYYVWAVARWKEREDRRSYDLISHQIETLYQFV